MKLLILGGTRFLGRHLVMAARERGHELTLFNRGITHPGLFAGVEEIHGNRDGGLEPLKGRRWDAVIDTSGYVPRLVRASAELLHDAAPHYTFISTLSVFADLSTQGLHESSPLATMADETVEEISGETYGPLKVLCERAVQEVYARGALIIRPGLIVGPHDPTDRFTYWPVRVARGGEVLAPDAADNPVQFIDVRDLAAWTMRLVEAERGGVYNATGPEERLTLGELLATCRRVSEGDAHLTWVGEEFLLEHEVQPWIEMPLWIPGEEAVGFGSFDVSKALAAGLTLRPLPATIAATLEWAGTRPADYEWRAGISPEREQALLQVWRKAPHTA